MLCQRMSSVLLKMAGESLQTFTIPWFPKIAFIVCQQWKKLIIQLKFWKSSNILHPLTFDKCLNMSGIIRTTWFLWVIWIQAAFKVFMFFIKSISFHKYQNKQELDNCIFVSNVFNSDSLSITLGFCTFLCIAAICKCTHKTWNEK